MKLFAGTREGMAKNRILHGLDKQSGQGEHRNASLSRSAAFCQIKIVVDFDFWLGVSNEMALDI